jgi:hypothetical protein
MTINCLVRVNVATPRTPVPLSTDPTITASKLFLQVIPGLTGKTYFGIQAMARRRRSRALAERDGRLFRALRD